MPILQFGSADCPASQRERTRREHTFHLRAIETSLQRVALLGDINCLAGMCRHAVFLGSDSDSRGQYERPETVAAVD